MTTRMFADLRWPEAEDCAFCTDSLRVNLYNLPALVANAMPDGNAFMVRLVGEKSAAVLARFFFERKAHQPVGIGAWKHMSKRQGDKREKLLEAAEDLMLRRGFWGTTVEDVCAAAGVTKGSFFHYFQDKEGLALAALERFVGTMVGRIRQAIASVDRDDELGQICAYCDLIGQVAQAPDAQQGCLIAAFVMETRTEDGAFANRCWDYFGKWIDILKNEFAAALMRRQRPDHQLAGELAHLCVCVIEGALVLAKGRRDPSIVASALEHFKQYAIWRISQEHATESGDPSSSQQKVSFQVREPKPGSSARKMSSATKTGRNRIEFVKRTRVRLNERAARRCPA